VGRSILKKKSGADLKVASYFVFQEETVVESLRISVHFSAKIRLMEERTTFGLKYFAQ
jgi:hypothetical protein